MLPFLKFIAYNFTLRSAATNPVKKVWSAHVSLQAAELGKNLGWHLRYLHEFAVFFFDLVLVAKLNMMHCLVGRLSKVPNVEVFLRVDCKELAQAVEESVLDRHRGGVATIVVHLAPLDLHNR